MDSDDDDDQKIDRNHMEQGQMKQQRNTNSDDDQKIDGIHTEQG